jgi:chemotaxis protein methyltransferase CheR
MRPSELEFFARLVFARTGVVLGEDKAYVVKSRLDILAAELGMRSHRDIFGKMTAGGDEKLADRVVDCLLTKETSFFRNPSIFEALGRHIMPDLLGRKPRPWPIRIWCGGCATGQEPYTVAMLMRERCLCQGPGKLDLLATDISPTALEQARKGEYSQLEVTRGLPVTHLIRYFKQRGHRWHLNQEIRDRVRFQTGDLLGSRLPAGRFDIIFCRNVLIYFSDTDKRKCLERLSASLAPGGYLFLGASETTFRHTNLFKHEQWENVVFYRVK